MKCRAGGRGWLGTCVFGFVHFCSQGPPCPCTPARGRSAPLDPPHRSFRSFKHAVSRPEEVWRIEVRHRVVCGPPRGVWAKNVNEQDDIPTILLDQLPARSTGLGRPLQSTRRRQSAAAIEAKPGAGGPGGAAPPGWGAGAKRPLRTNCTNPKRPDPNHPRPPAQHFIPSAPQPSHAHALTRAQPRHRPPDPPQPPSPPPQPHPSAPLQPHPPEAPIRFAPSPPAAAPQVPAPPRPCWPSRR